VFFSLLRTNVASLYFGTSTTLSLAVAAISPTMRELLLSSLSSYRGEHVKMPSYTIFLKKLDLRTSAVLKFLTFLFLQTFGALDFSKSLSAMMQGASMRKV
jgi:hypothetical protein